MIPVGTQSDQQIERGIGRSAPLVRTHTAVGKEPLSQAAVQEIFFSYQGEGPWKGTPQVFIRFFGCHMRCVWCDTPKALEGEDHMTLTVEEVRDRIEGWRKTGCRWVSLTGGEPLMQTDFLAVLVPALKQDGWKVYLETSGVLVKAFERLRDAIDVVSMDIKLPSSTRQRPFWDEHRAFLCAMKGISGYAKMVVTPETRTEEIEYAIRLLNEEDPRRTLVIQPQTGEMFKGGLAKACEAVALAGQKLRDVRLGVQMHALTGLR